MAYNIIIYLYAFIWWMVNGEEEKQKQQQQQREKNRKLNVECEPDGLYKVSRGWSRALLILIPDFSGLRTQDSRLWILDSNVLKLEKRVWISLSFSLSFSVLCISKIPYRCTKSLILLSETIKNLELLPLFFCLCLCRFIFFFKTSIKMTHSLLFPFSFFLFFYFSISTLFFLLEDKQKI